MSKINWSKMHMHSYNDCVFCGGECTDEESRDNWHLAISELKIEEEKSAYLGKDTQRLKYLRKKIDDKLNYRMN